MATMNAVQALNSALKAEMERDRDVVVLGEDVGKNGGVFRVTEGLYDRFGPERVIDMPLAEMGIVGAAIGMAFYGLKPVVEIQFMGFLYVALEQLFSHASRIRTRSRGRFAASLVVRTPYGAGVKALEHHSESGESLFCHMPGLRVVVPSSPIVAKGLLVSAIREPDPVLFLEPTRLYRLIKEDVPEIDYTVPLDKARIVREGNDVTVIAWGSMLQRAMKAVEDFTAEVIDLVSLSPLDEETILRSVRKTGRAVIVHEAPSVCGLGAEISALIAEFAMLHLKAPIVRVTSYDVVLPLPKLESHYLPSVEKIRKAIETVMQY